MINQYAIDRATEILQERWDEYGACESCGWHASLSEHDVESWQIKDALSINNGILTMQCISKDEDWEDLDSHRGVRVPLL